MQAKGKEPTDDKWKAKYKEPQAPDTEGLPELPDGWCWANGGQLFSWASGKFLPAKAQDGGGFPVYGGNGINGYHSENIVDAPTMIIGRVGAHCGNVYVTEGEAWVTDNAIFATSMPPEIELGYTHLVFRNANLNANSTGSGQPFVNQPILNETMIPMPSLVEQREIVMELSRRYSVLDKLEADTFDYFQKLLGLRQSILRQAFTGKLVPQDPDDEPASVLLERIKAERAAQGNGKGKVKRGRGRGKVVQAEKGAE